MLCKHCLGKAFARKQVPITCKTCGKEVYVPLYNNNCCGECNEKAGTCEECGRRIENILPYKNIKETQ